MLKCMEDFLYLNVSLSESFGNAKNIILIILTTFKLISEKK